MSETPTTSRVPAARRTREMIGQGQALADLEKAALSSDDSFKVVLIRAEGGRGKTRLLEEMQKRYGPKSLSDPNTSLSSLSDSPLVARLIDVIDTRLHDRYRFVTEMRESLMRFGGALDFTAFDAASSRVRRLTASGALLDSIDEAQRNASDAFVSDLARAVAKRRIVFLVDTVERLSYEASEWLLEEQEEEENEEKKLLEPLLLSTDLEIRTHHWLLRRFIGEMHLKNITLVLAGRGREGSAFFERVTDAAHACDREVVEISLHHLTINQTKQYFDQLADDWQAVNPDIAGHYAEAANPYLDRYKVIGIYTHGVPVRLALYAQVLVEGLTIPSAFRLSFSEACHQANLPVESIKFDEEPPLPEETTPELQHIQWNIEEEFLNLLFADPDDRRTRLLRTLVRAPRGLTAEQLHFVLDAPTGTNPATWQEEVRSRTGNHAEKLEELLEILKDISDTEYLAKARSSIKNFGPVLDETKPETATFRVGLQDEIYRIYAEHTGLLADPVSVETTFIRQNLNEDDRLRYTQNRLDEQTQRHELYANLAAFADYQYQRCLETKRRNLLDDEIRFEEKLRLDDPDTYHFWKLPPKEVEARHLLHSALAFFEIERMVYRLLLDPERNLNLEYTTLEDDNDRAARQEEDFWAQAEMWRVIHDDGLMKFIDLQERKAAKARKETSVDVLRRFAEQENVARWIKRFVLRGSPDRAIAFGEEVQRRINNWPRGDEHDIEGRGWEQYNRWGSWNHTLARADRIIWTQVAHIRRGQNVGDATSKIAAQINNLERLYTKDVKTLAIENAGHQENGFAAALDGTPEHPAYARVRRLLSHANNHLGYGQRTLGQMLTAMGHYGQALDYIRPEVNKMQAHRAKVLNNLSRVLSELGWNGLGVCMDGRDLRWELAEEVPLASSYNTLALIYDDMGRYEDAPLLSAKAIAYCRRAAESRQLVLSLRQMAESLRHLADRWRARQRLAVTADAYYNAADTLLTEALEKIEKLGEVERLVEIHLERGSLYRDLLQQQPDDTDTYERALLSLDIAERRALEHGLVQHVLDARVNKARVHYYGKVRDRAGQVLQSIQDDTAYRKHRIVPGYLPDAERVELRNQNWTFRHLGTAHRIGGWIALDQFHERVHYYKLQHPEETPEARQERQKLVVEDTAAKDALLAAAEAYALSIAYAELYSTRSRSIGAIQNDLYSRLRASNRSELDLFRNYLEQVGQKYTHTLSSIPLLLRLMTEFFGLPEKATALDQLGRQTTEGDYD